MGCKGLIVPKRREALPWPACRKSTPYTLYLLFEALFTKALPRPSLWLDSHSGPSLNSQKFFFCWIWRRLVVALGERGEDWPTNDSFSSSLQSSEATSSDVHLSLPTACQPSGQKEKHRSKSSPNIIKIMLPKILSQADKRPFCWRSVYWVISRD